MKKYLIIIILLLLPLGCVSLDDLVPDFVYDEEEEECWDGNWQGTQPKSLVTPDGYSYHCDDVTDMFLGANGDYSDSDESGHMDKEFWW